MSLTSYRAAPPRDRVFIVERAFRVVSRAFYRFGGDLLSRVLRRSTIGAAALNGRVRDGIGCFARALATKPAKRALLSGPETFGGAPRERLFQVGTDFGSHDFRPKPNAALWRGPVFHWIGIKPVGRLVPVN